MKIILLPMAQVHLHHFNKHDKKYDFAINYIL